MRRGEGRDGAGGRNRGDDGGGRGGHKKISIQGTIGDDGDEDSRK
jgi:hypothetical protein